MGQESQRPPHRRPRVIVTRAEGRAETLVNRLEERGYDVVVCPLIATEPLGDDPIDPAP